MKSKVTVNDSGLINIRLNINADSDRIEYFRILDPAVAEQLGLQLIAAAGQARERIEMVTQTYR